MLRFRSLDAIRGIAAAIVALVHLSAAGHFYAIPVIRHGGLAVPLFFILSGFVMAESYGRRISSKAELSAFFIRRFGRVYPIHFATLVALVMLEVMKLVMVSHGIQSGQAPFTGTNSLSSLVANVFLLHSIIPFGDYTWNGPSWSLSVEFYVYALFAGITFFSAQRTKKPTIIVWLVSGALLLALEFSETRLHTTSGLGLLQCIFGFMSGVLLHSLFMRSPDFLKRSATAWEVGVSALAVMIFWFAPFGDVGTIFSFSIVIFIFAAGRGSISAVLQTFPFQFLGMISLSIYLVHFVILSVLNGAVRAAQSAFKVTLMTDGNMINFGPAFAMDAFALVYMLVVIVVAALAFIFIEEPCRLYFNSVSHGQPARYSIRPGIAQIRRLSAESASPNQAVVG